MRTQNNKDSKIQLVIFDLDGTITRPYLDFGKIRKAIGAPDTGILVLDYVRDLPAAEREKAYEILDGFEKEAAVNCQPQDGAIEAISELQRQGTKIAVFTRNSRKSAQATLKRLGLAVDEIISRDDGPPKPSPDAIFALLNHLGISNTQAIMVGDFRVDIMTGKNAGLKTVLIENAGTDHQIEVYPDLRIRNLMDLMPAIDRWNQEL